MSYRDDVPDCLQAEANFIHATASRLKKQFFSRHDKLCFSLHYVTEYPISGFAFPASRPPQLREAKSRRFTEQTNRFRRVISCLEVTRFKWVSTRNRNSFADIWMTSMANAQLNESDFWKNRQKSISCRSHPISMELTLWVSHCRRQRRRRVPQHFNGNSMKLNNVCSPHLRRARFTCQCCWFVL